MNRLVARGVDCRAKTTGCKISSASTNVGESLTTRPGRRVRIAAPIQIKINSAATGNTPGEKTARPPGVNFCCSFAEAGVQPGGALGEGVRVGVAFGVGENAGVGVAVTLGVGTVVASAGGAITFSVLPCNPLAT